MVDLNRKFSRRYDLRGLLREHGSITFNQELTYDLCSGRYNTSTIYLTFE